MMRLKAGFAVALCFACVLCLALVGCGSVDKSQYVGTWSLESSNDETFDSNTISMMKSLDLDVTLTFREDGTGVLDMMGNDSHDVTWEASSSTEGTATLDGATSKIELADDTLSLVDGNGMTMTFKKSDKAETASSSAAPETASEASAASQEAEQQAASGASSEEAEESKAAESA